MPKTKERQDWMKNSPDLTEELNARMSEIMMNARGYRDYHQ
jgi:hypothetical protein